MKGGMPLDLDWCVRLAAFAALDLLRYEGGGPPAERRLSSHRFSPRTRGLVQRRGRHVPERPARAERAQLLALRCKARAAHRRVRTGGTFTVLGVMVALLKL